MKIENNTVVSIRYQMKNGKGEIIENNLAGPPVAYVHGADFTPAFASELSGLQPGNVTRLTLLQAEHSGMLDDDFAFDIVIDDVRPASPEEMASGKPASPNDADNKPDCGSGCRC